MLTLQLIVLVIFLAACMLASESARARGCDNVAPDYTEADLRRPMRFFVPEETGCSGNAVSNPYMAVGEITAETPAAFELFARQHPPEVPIEFASLGGNLIAGMKLGEKIRAKGYSTSLGKYCASACAYAILGGVNRYIVPKKFDLDDDYDDRILGATGTKLGVHQFYQLEAFTEPLKKAFSAADRSADQMIMGMLLEYTLRMGVDIRLVSAASNVLPKELRLLTEKEMLDWNIDNVRRRFSPLVFRAFGKTGAYVETSNIRSTRTSFLRIFCRNSIKEPLFAFIIDTPLQSSVPSQSQIALARANIRSMLSKLNIAFELNQGKPNTIPVQVQEIQSILQGNSAVRVFAVVRASGLTRLEAERLSRVALQDNGELSRSDWSFQDIVKFRIEGDRKLLRLAMKNCIE